MFGGPGDGGLRGETWLPLGERAGAGGLPGQPRRRTGRNTGDRLRLRSRLRRSLRPVRERPPDGAGAGRILRGARPGSRCGEGGARPRPHPGSPLRDRAALVRGHPAHRAVLRNPLGRASLPAGGSRTGRDGHAPQVPAPRRGGGRVPLPRSLPRLLLGRPTTGTSRGSAYTASPDASTPRPGAEPPGRGLRPLRPAGLAAGVRRPKPGLRLMGQEADQRRQGGELKDALLPGQRVPAGRPLDHRGGLWRDRGLRGRGPLPPLPGAGGHHRPGRPRPGGAPQPAAPEFLRRGCRQVQEPGVGRPAGTGLPKAGRLLGLPIPG